MSKKSEAEAALDAMIRAAGVARERAAGFGAPLVVWRDGAVTYLDPGTGEVIRRDGEPLSVPSSSEDEQS